MKSVNEIPTNAIRMGSAGPVGTMMLLKSLQRLHAPLTQDPPLDFIRWHAPGDWEGFEPETAEPSIGPEGSKDKWPLHGRLSQRMSDQGNLWRKFWKDAPALQADDQKTLLDPNREGKKIVHYLEHYSLISFLSKWSVQPSEDQPTLLTRQTAGT